MNELEILTKLLESATSDPSTVAKKLLDRFGTVLRLSEAEPELISEACGDRTVAIFIKLATALASRRITDSFRVGKRYEESEIKRYLCALFLGSSVETVYMLSFDKDMKLIFVDYVCEGTVNALGILPRRLLDIAIKRKASSVILAHNHPGGVAKPSDDDLVSTARIYNLFDASGIKAIAHYVVSDGECYKIDGE